MKSNPYFNSECYPDPTAYEGTKNIIKEDAETEKRIKELMHVLKFIIRSMGFELVERVKLKDVKTGRIYK